LHIACRNDGKIRLERKKTRKALIKTLLKADSKSVIAEDKHGLNAIEHALYSKLDARTIKMLQCVSCRVREKILKKQQKKAFTESKREVETEVETEAETETGIALETRIISSDSESPDSMSKSRVPKRRCSILAVPVNTAAA